jgi:hypothetical protein
MTQVSTIDSIIGLLGKRWDDPVLHETLGPRDLDKHAEDRGGRRIADFRSSYGFELIFSESAPTDELSKKSPICFVLTQIVFYRDREFGACEWRGPLPFGILFDESPETMLSKVHVPPNEQLDNAFTGFALWHFTDYSLHVSYSTIENLILRVRIMAPGERVAY